MDVVNIKMQVPLTCDILHQYPKWLHHLLAWVPVYLYYHASPCHSFSCQGVLLFTPFQQGVGMIPQTDLGTGESCNKDIYIH